jgi:hypothetical protein
MPELAFVLLPLLDLNPTLRSRIRVKTLEDWTYVSERNLLLAQRIRDPNRDWLALDSHALQIALHEYLKLRPTSCAIYAETHLHQTSSLSKIFTPR